MVLSIGALQSAVGDAESEIDVSSYGEDLFLTGAEIKARGIDRHRKQILPHRGTVQNLSHF
ncbi:hypothetical protein CV770_40515 [Bradyrhizobium sp. AC87j1]|nr:hypothetical protein CV770_40515 [Bradyrhizobium sp. AC87j1]